MRRAERTFRQKVDPKNLTGVMPAQGESDAISLTLPRPAPRSQALHLCSLAFDAVDAIDAVTEWGENHANHAEWNGD